MSLINDALKRARQTQNQRPPERLPGASLEPVLRSTNTVSPLARIVPVALVLLLLGGSWLLWRSWKTRSGAARQVAQAQVTNAPSTAAATPPKPTPSTGTNETKATSTAVAPVRPKVEINTNIVTRPTPAEAKPAVVVDAETAPKPGSIAAAMHTPFTATASALAGNKSRIEDETASTPARAPAQVSAAPVAPPPVAAIPRPARVAEPLPPSADFPALKLQGVFYRISKPSVLINGQTLYVGDLVGDVKVVKIERQSVTVEWKGQQKTLLF